MGLFQWFIVESLLIVIFVIRSVIFTKRVLSSYSGRDKIIDVKAEVIREDKKRLN